MPLTHWGRVTHICVVKLTITGSDNGLSPGRRQAIIWINAGILLIGPLGTNFSEILFGIQTSSFKKMHLKMSSAKWSPFYLGLNVLVGLCQRTTIDLNRHSFGESTRLNETCIGCWPMLLTLILVISETHMRDTRVWRCWNRCVLCVSC